jgi:type II secretory pathway component PulF
LSKSLEPALLATMGIIFALIVAGLLLPIYDLINQIGV